MFIRMYVVGHHSSMGFEALPQRIGSLFGVEFAEAVNSGVLGLFFLSDRERAGHFGHFLLHRHAARVVVAVSFEVDFVF